MRSLLILAAVLLAACGTKGGLTLPPPASTPPTATKAPVDNSSKLPAEAAR